MSKKSVLGIVRTEIEAENLIGDLRTLGFAASDVSVLFPDKGQTRDFAHVQGTKAPEGALIGTGAGGAVGGVIGLLAGLGAIALPGLGLLIAAGPVMAALGAAAVGAAVGSLTGALVGLGVPEIQAKLYEGKIQGGNVLVAVHTEDAEHVEKAKRVFEKHHSENVAVAPETAVPLAKEEPTASSALRP